jgi:hypothetical protein
LKYLENILTTIFYVLKIVRPNKTTQLLEREIPFKRIDKPYKIVHASSPQQNISQPQPPQTGDYYDKYMKYKNKYLKLCEKMN